MKLVHVEQMRKLDERTIEEAGIAGEVLMDRAGRGLAESIFRIIDAADMRRPRVLFIAGKGNNGGDAFVAARYLAQRGCHVEVWLAARAKDLKGDAKLHFEKMQEAGVPCDEVVTKIDWGRKTNRHPRTDIIVDGLLGTGAKGAPKGAVAEGVRCINALRGCAVTVAIDVPSGLDADTGHAEGDAVYADVTVTMGLAKAGFVTPEALDHVGHVEVVDIGIPQAFIDDAEAAEAEIIGPEELARIAAPRQRDAHKGSYGHVLLIGGAQGYMGAITMAAQAAVRSGVGLVSVLVPESLATAVASNVLEAMVTGLPENDSGSISDAMLGEWRGRINDYSAILLGPGMSRHDDTLLLVRQIIRESTVPLVIDADAISVLEGQPHWMQKANCPVVLTPHPGELARLFSQNVQDVQEDRAGMAVAAAKYTDATVVLKGAGTVVAHKDQRPHINTTGNPGMATGGSGDVLAGLLAGMVGQRVDPFLASCGAVYIHGRAGDRVALRTSQQGLIPTDLISEIPSVFGELRKT